MVTTWSLRKFHQLVVIEIRAVCFITLFLVLVNELDPLLRVIELKIFGAVVPLERIAFLDVRPELIHFGLFVLFDDAAAKYARGDFG